VGSFKNILLKNHWAQIILGWRGFKFIQIKEIALLQGEIIVKG
jgi:hypothetical protein